MGQGSCITTRGSTQRYPYVTNLCLEHGPRRKEEDKERTVVTIKKLCEIDEREYGWMESSTEAVGTEAEDGG